MHGLFRTLLPLVLAVCAAFAVQAEVYKWTDENGKVHYSDAVPEIANAQQITLDEINTFTDISISDAPGWQGFYQPERKPGVKNVVMYSTARCGYCKKARRYFTEHDIAFTEKDIEEDKAAWAEYQQLEATGVPVILIGHKRLNGFNEASFEQLFYGES